MLGQDSRNYSLSAVSRNNYANENLQEDYSTRYQYDILSRASQTSLCAHGKQCKQQTVYLVPYPPAVVPLYCCCCHYCCQCCTDAFAYACPTVTPQCQVSLDWDHTHPSPRNYSSFLLIPPNPELSGNFSIMHLRQG